ncbi:MAG: hypothetical protein RR851_10260 [Clostridium sp.]
MKNWDEVRNGLKGLAYAKVIIETYIEFGSYKALKEEYGVEFDHLNNIVGKSRKKLREKYPELMKSYDCMARQNQENKKLGKKQLTEQERKWKELRELYKGVELSKYLMEQYILIGSSRQLESIYGVKKAHIMLTIRNNMDKLKEIEPKLCEMFETKISYNKKNGNLFSSEINQTKDYLGGLPRFEPKLLDSLPKKIEYPKFRDFALKFDTGFRTGDQLIKLANERGIQVYDLIEGKEKTVKI